MSTETPDAGNGADVVVTDRQLFEGAISSPEPQPEPQPQPEPSVPQEQTTQQQPQPETEPGLQGRDAQGRWTSKSQQPQQGQQRAQQQQRPPAPAGGQQQQPQPHHVPLRELLDERERRYRIQAEADQMRAAWAEMQRQQQMLQQQQLPQTIYDNPDQYLAHNVIQPLRNEGHMAMLQIKDGLSREMANTQYGEKNVNDALGALASFRYTPNGDHIFRQIMSSGHPYGALIRWFQTARAQQAIGPDPDAWVKKQREAWLDDEAMQIEAVRRYQARQQRQPQQQPPRGGGPLNVQLPPSLSSLPASSGRGDQQGDMSDLSLYRFATSR